jgi:hypothetical protein
VLIKICSLGLELLFGQTDTETGRYGKANNRILDIFRCQRSEKNFKGISHCMNFA